MQTGNTLEIVGNTPLIKLKVLSEMTGCQIFGKAEFLNPGGSIKDRAAKGIIMDAETRGLLKPGFTIFEGTAGNTGIGLATLSLQRGYKCTIVMPDNQSAEKYQILEAMGVKIIKVPAVPFADQNHFYHTAKKLAQESDNSFWANQFENTANSEFHFQSTGPEIWHQTMGRLDFFVAATGSGGTISGVSRFLKSRNESIKIILADPFGSGMFDYFHNKEIKTEGSSITEGIGIMRLTENFKSALIDDALKISDRQMINMLYFLARNEGLVVGTSAALNVAACYQMAKLPENKGKTFVTVLCDSGLRYQSRIFNDAFLKEKNLIPTEVLQ
jgi:cysteine synthase A